MARGAAMAGWIGGVTFYPLLIFGGLWVPRAVMPSVLGAISNLTPLGAAVQAMQGGRQTGIPPVSPLLVLLAYAVVFGWLAVRFFR